MILYPCIRHVKAAVILGELAHYLRSAVWSHIDTSLEIADLAQVKVRIQTRLAHFLSDLSHGLAFVFFISRTDVSDLDIIPAESKQSNRRRNQDSKLHLVKPMTFLLRSQGLIPCRQHHGDDRYTKKFTIYIKSDIYSLFFQAMENGHKLILAAERTSSDEDRMRIMQFHTGSLCDLHELVQSSEQMWASKKRIRHRHCRAGPWMYGHRLVVFLTKPCDLLELFDPRIYSGLIHKT